MVRKCVAGKLYSVYLKFLCLKVHLLLQKTRLIVQFVEMTTRLGFVITLQLATRKMDHFVLRATNKVLNVIFRTA